MDVKKLSSAQLKKLSAEMKKDTSAKGALVAIGELGKARQGLVKDSKALADVVKKNPDI